MIGQDRQNRKSTNQHHGYGCAINDTSGDKGLYEIRHEAHEKILVFAFDFVFTGHGLAIYIVKKLKKVMEKRRTR